MTSNITIGLKETNSAGDFRPNPVMRLRFFKTLPSAGILGLLILLGLPLQLSAQTKDSNSPPSNRWLVIMETSASMQPRAVTAEQIAAGLVSSGMNGQMRPGDTVGVWTFDGSLHTGDFPLQVWNPQSAKTIAQQVFTFLHSRKYEGQSRLDNVVAAMNQVVKNSEYITIILISDGMKTLNGIPFDEKINAAYQQWQNEQTKARMPFVTLLRAAHGKMAQYAVSAPPWPINLPPLPKEMLALAKTEMPKPAPAPKPAAPRIGAPLILRGKPKEATSESPSTASNAVPAAATAKQGSGGQTTEVQAAVSGPLTHGESESTPETTTEQANQNKNPPAVKPEPSATGIPSEVNSLETTATRSEFAKTSSETTEATVPNVHSETQVGAEGPDDKGREPLPGAAQTSSAPSQVAVVAGTTPDKGNLTLLWIGIPVALGVCAVTLLLVLRRSRNAEQASLITRSFDRDKR